jgi:hypothetical protein
MTGMGSADSEKGFRGSIHEIMVSTTMNMNIDKSR